MDKVIHVLLIDDDEFNAALIEKEFRKNAYATFLKRIETKEDLEKVLGFTSWDVIIFDPVLIRMNSTAVLDLIKRKNRGASFIIAPVDPNEENKIEIFHTEPDNCILKETLIGLLPVIERALDKIQIHKEHAQANAALNRCHSELEKEHRLLKENQAQLIQAEKMATLGQLSAGIAHEINNPLNYVMSNLETLGGYVGAFETVLRSQERLENGVRETGSRAFREILDELAAVKREQGVNRVRQDLKNLLKETHDGLEYIKDLTRRLKIFARPDKNERQLFDVNESVETALKLTWHELKLRCEIKKELGELPSIRCLPGPLSQVFMNLLSNAAQAMTGARGEITVTSGTGGGRVFVKIADTGKGLSPENLAKIFTPFFTTKAPGEGTGLGLSISHDIVKEHEGRIDVQSEEGKGSVFTVWLPLT